MNAAIWVTASPHEWEWTKSDQVAMARFCCWANLTIEQQAATIAGLRARLKERCIVKLTFGSLFAGIGGFDLGFERAGMECKWQVEINEYCRRVLAKHWPDVRRWDDVRTWPQPDTERVDVICGGFPCQDISYAGRGAGLAGERSGLFFEVIRIVRALEPRIVVLENVAALLTRGMDEVLGTLASLGFDAEWECLPAAAFGAPHIRDRAFIVAHSKQDGFNESHANSLQMDTGEAAARVQGAAKAIVAFNCGQDGSCGASPRSPRNGYFAGEKRTAIRCEWIAEPAVDRVADGVPFGMDRIGALGNSIVPQVAEWIGRNIVLAAGGTP